MKVEIYIICAVYMQIFVIIIAGNEVARELALVRILLQCQEHYSLRTHLCQLHLTGFSCVLIHCYSKLLLTIHKYNIYDFLLAQIIHLKYKIFMQIFEKVNRVGFCIPNAITVQMLYVEDFNFFMAHNLARHITNPSLIALLGPKEKVTDLLELIFRNIVDLWQIPLSLLNKLFKMIDFKLITVLNYHVNCIVAKRYF
jgi:hypothetical protein